MDDNDAKFELTDTHCHMQSIGQANLGEEMTRQLWAKAGDRSAKSVIEDAREAGVTRIICVGCDLDDSKLAINFVKNRKNCWASIGIHPHEAKSYADDQLKQAGFTSLATREKVVAVGECGLDYFYEHSPKADQIAILKFQFEVAKTHNLPMIFHVREALDDFWPIFDSYSTADQPIRGVLHSFTDTAENLDKAVVRGLFIGVNGIATFAKGDARRAVYRSIPLSNLVLETDAPFLTPTPYRGTINESKYICVIADFISKLRGQSYEEIATATTHNAQALFGLT
jgi:TatD DNase family protein